MAGKDGILMSFKPMPYFMKNKEWYRIIPLEEQKPGEKHIILTEKAPPKARKSYEEWYDDSEGD